MLAPAYQVAEIEKEVNGIYEGNNKQCLLQNRLQ
jgi:hypothetical protein